MTDARAQSTAAPQRPSQLRRVNVRTAIVLAAIAAVFFIGIIASKFLGDGSTGISVVGAAVLLFLALAIGRNLRR